MNIEQLRHFSEIARCGSLSKAAQVLFMTQQNLSVSVKLLEKELGEQVFNRSSVGMMLTPFGERLLPYARNIIRLVDDIPDKTFQNEYTHVPKLSVAGCMLKAASWAVAQVYNAHKNEGVRIDYYDVSDNAIPEMVASGKIDIGCFVLSSYTTGYYERIIKRNNLTFVHVANAPITVMVGKYNPLYTRKEDWVTLDMIKDYPLVYKFSDHPTELQKQLGLYQRKNIINCSSDNVKNDIITYTDCISVISSHIPVFERINYFEGRRVFKIKDIEHYKMYGYLIRKNLPLTPIAEEFIEEFKKVFEE